MCNTFILILYLCKTFIQWWMTIVSFLWLALLWLTEMTEQKKAYDQSHIYTHTHTHTYNLWPPECTVSNSSSFTQRMFFSFFCYSCFFFFRFMRIAYYLLQTLLSMTYIFCFCFIDLMSSSFFQLSWLSLPILYWNSECIVLTRWLCTFLTLGIFFIF